MICLEQRDKQAVNRSRRSKETKKSNIVKVNASPCLTAFWRVAERVTKTSLRARVVAESIALPGHEDFDPGTRS